MSVNRRDRHAPARGRPIARRAAFTLVEILVVIAIIGMLVGISLPAVSYSRNSSRSMQCMSNLRQIGVAMASYLDVHGQTFPNCAEVPGIPAGSTLPSLVTTLGKFVENNTAVFECPADVGPVNAGPGSNQVSYFVTYGLSYDYPQGTLAGKTRLQVLRVSSTAQGSSVRLPILWDYDSFHGAAGDNGSRNYLFLDGHADSQLDTQHY